MMRPSDRVELAFAANQAYFDGLLVTAVSAARFASPDVELSYTILDGGISDSDFVFLEESIRRYHSRSGIVRKRIDEVNLDGLPAWNGNRMAYARLMLPSLLPDVDFVIYSDVDFLWFDDVSELWKLRDAGFPLLGVVDGFKGTIDVEEKWFRERRLAFNRDSYVCSGMLLMNLKAFREESLSVSLMGFLREHQDVLYADQSAINALLGNLIGLLPPKWQRFSWKMNDDLFDSGAAVHYAGEAPWKMGRWTDGLSDARLVWFAILAKIRGRSKWTLLRKCYGGAWRIAFRRSLVLVARWKLTRVLLHAFLWMLRRDLYMPTLIKFSGGFDRKAVVSRFLSGESSR